MSDYQLLKKDPLHGVIQNASLSNWRRFQRTLYFLI